VKFITNDERDLVQVRLKADSDATRHEAFGCANFGTTLVDVTCMPNGFSFHTMSLQLYMPLLFLVSINSSNPLITRSESLATIIASLDYTAADAQVMIIPPYAIATILTVFWAWASDRRIAAAHGFSSPPSQIIGYIILIADHRARRQLQWHDSGGCWHIYPSTSLVCPVRRSGRSQLPCR